MTAPTTTPEPCYPDRYPDRTGRKYLAIGPHVWAQADTPEAALRRVKTHIDWGYFKDSYREAEVAIYDVPEDAHVNNMWGGFTYHNADGSDEERHVLHSMHTVKRPRSRS